MLAALLSSLFKRATTVDVMQARMQRELPIPIGKDDVFDPAQLAPKFQAPDTMVAGAWALPLVAAAYRSVPLLLCPALRYCCNSSF